MSALGYPLYINGRRVNRPINIRHQPTGCCGAVDPSMGAYVDYPVHNPGLGNLAVGAGAFIIIGVAVTAGLAVSGYYVGKSVAPSKSAEDQYAFAGALSNVFFPIIGPAVVATVGLAKG